MSKIKHRDKTMEKPSKNHTNRKAYNWLLYDIADKYLIEYIPFYKGVMLDLGCADKPFEKFFTQYVDSYIGVDWENTSHRSRADIVSDLNKKIEIEDSYADTIVALNVLEHLYNPQLFLQETYRLLKSDGTLILHIPFQWWVHEAPHDYFRYTPYGLRYLLNNAGYEDIHIQPASGFFTTILMKINYFSLRAAKGSPTREKVVKTLLKPFWYVNQILAPKLDAMHRGWSLEAQSFFVVAQKKEKKAGCDKKVIGSLTSYGKRIESVHLAIESILNQSKKVDALILWLAEDEFTLNSLPRRLQELHAKELIQIKFCKDIKSYKKLIPALALYPEDIIITFDDDILYDSELVAKLYAEYLKSPQTIHCARGHKMLFDKDNALLPYEAWNLKSDSSIEGYDIFPTGAGGILYPPQCFHQDISNEKLFLELAPNADDIWFKVMTLLNKRKSKILPQSNKQYSFITPIEGTQENALYHKNVGEGLNDKYLKKILDYYKISMLFQESDITTRVVE